MMNDDDDDVLGIDLDAWQPPPPANVADRVIARMREDTTSMTVQALPVESVHAPRRRWWIFSTTAVALAATTLVVFVATRAPSDASGSIAAARPTHVSLGPSSAEVDANTSIHWKREGYRITARQAAGTATWRVDEDDTLTIETALGSIEATNASLRVEVKMHDDKRTIALSAVTAAAIAAVTIVVYEGAVRTGGTTVAAGTRYQIKANGENVIEEDAQLAVAASPDLVAKISALETELAEKRALIEALQQQRTVDPFAASQDAVPERVSRATIERVMRGLVDEARGCGGDFTGKLTASVHVKPDGTVENVTIEPSDAKPSACLAAVIRRADFGVTKTGATLTYPYTFTKRIPATSTFDPFRSPRPSKDDLSTNPFAKCDANQLIEEGKLAFSEANFRAALQHFETSYRCDGKESTLRLMFASACKLKNVSKAGQYWKKMKSPARDSSLALCAMNGITADDLENQGIGRLRITNSVPAVILLDGETIGTTPIDHEVAVGKHKVTFMIGADKHTFLVEVKAGGTVTLDKEIE